MNANYICPRCNYATNQKTHMIKHVGRKKLCKLDNMDVVPGEYIKDILKEIEINDYIKLRVELKDLKNMKKDVSKGSNVFDYNDPNIDYINDKHYRKYIKDVNTAYLLMCREIYFNPRHPENRSLYKTNKRDKYITYYQNGKWQTGSIDNVLAEIKEVIYEAFDKGSMDDRLNELSFEIENNETLRTKIDRDIIAECYNNKLI